jgi:hypothetical protein
MPCGLIKKKERRLNRQRKNKGINEKNYMGSKVTTN